MKRPEEPHDPPQPEDSDAWWETGEMRMEITDTLDLHSFPPKAVAELVQDYLDLAHAQGLRRLRIIHGKGIGVQRERVRSLLGKDPRVISFSDAPDAGSWGATVVELGE